MLKWCTSLYKLTNGSIVDSISTTNAHANFGSNLVFKLIF